MSWSTYDWKKYLKKDTEIPEHPHYAVMVFRDTQFTERGYDRDDPDTTVTVRVVEYFAFPDKETWEKMIESYFQARHQPKQAWHSTTGNENLVFFHSGGRGKVEVKIGVNVSVAKG